jgi:protein involved in polysaccharide export with SLBB domain
MLICVPQKTSSQILPDYSERTFVESLDSLRSMTSPDYFSVTATEGIINPDEFKVGPGDKIFISITGITETAHNLVINHEGWLYVPKVGGINLQNLSLAEAKSKISEEINRYYKNVRIFISLNDIRKIKVTLTGDVVKPASYVIAANSRLIDLVTYSTGLSRTANYRNIKIISKDSSQKSYDFLSFLRFGDYNQNPILKEGDVVLVDRFDRFVRISGEVKFPATYEFKENESAYQLIELAGGFLSTARLDTLEFITFSEDGKNQQSNFYSIDELKKDEIYLKHKDHVIIRQIPEYLIENYVLVDGFVKYPGWYKIIKDKSTLREVVEQAGGFREEASLIEATLTRTVQTDEKDPEYERLRLIEPKDMTADEYDYFKSKSRQTSGNVVVSFVELFENNNLKENLILKRGDVIKIPEQKNYIIMLGQFLNPGKIIYDPGLTINDYIQLAGGFGWRAVEDEVRVIKARTGEWIEEDDVESLEPGDTIWVPEDPPDPEFWDVFMDGLFILGQTAAIITAVTALVLASK